MNITDKQVEAALKHLPHGYPTTKTVYEWMLKSKFSHKWMVEDLLMSEEEAKDYFDKHEYQKTGRSWEVEV
jgi:hypothetical protein